MRFAADITPDESALGFERVEHLAHGPLVTAKIGTGLQAVKTIEEGVVSYAICSEHLIVLYAPATSLDDLRRRFGLGGGRRTG